MKRKKENEPGIRNVKETNGERKSRREKDRLEQSFRERRSISEHMSN